MKVIKNKKLEQLLYNVETLGWNYIMYQESEGTYNGWHCNERNYVEMEKYSPAGEDFIMIIDFDVDDPINSFMDSLNKYRDDFDIDEHVEKWIPQRGKGGCPGSILELIKDAKEIETMIVKLWKLLTRNMWERVCERVNYENEVE